MELQLSPLSIEKATRLWLLLKDYLPEDPPRIMLDYVHMIIDKIKEGNHQVYFDAIQLISGLPEEEIMRMEIIDILILFSNGLEINRILSLDVFCRKVGLNG